MLHEFLCTISCCCGTELGIQHVGWRFVSALLTLCDLGQVLESQSGLGGRDPKDHFGQGQLPLVKDQVLLLC